MGAERDYQAVLELARLALDVTSEAEWWECLADAVLGPLLAALVMTVNVVNASEMYGWFSAVYPASARRRIPIDSAMDVVLTMDHPFSVELRRGVIREPVQVTDLVPERRWRQLPSYERMRELTDGTHHLLLDIPRQPPYLESVSIVRAQRPFDDAEMRCARHLQTAVQLAVRHLRHVTATQRRWGPLFDREARNAADSLGITARERVVLELMAEGLATRHIGTRLHIATPTVHKHRQNLYRKLGVSDHANAVIRARVLGLLPDAAQAGATDPRPTANLTRRESGVLQLLSAGMTNPDISDVLGISTSTVNVHVGNVLSKLAARTRTEAVAVAFRSGLLPERG